MLFHFLLKNAGIIPYYRSWPLPFRSFPIHHSCSSMLHDVCGS